MTTAEKSTMHFLRVSGYSLFLSDNTLAPASNQTLVLNYVCKCQTPVS